MYKVESITFSGSGAVTNLVITDGNDNIVFRLGDEHKTETTRQKTAENAPKTAKFKPKQTKGKDNTTMIPKPLYARLMACKTEADLQQAIDDNKYWGDNANFKKTVEKARKKLNA